MFNWIRETIHLFFSQLGLHGQLLSFISSVATALGLLCSGFILYYIIRVVLQNTIKITNKRFPSKWRTALLKERFFIQLSFLLPAIFIKIIAPEFFGNGTRSEILFTALINLYIVANVTLILSAFLRAIGDILLQLEATKDKPIKSYIQIVSIFFWIIAIVLFISILINKSPTVFLAGLGAFSAVLMLVFQDTIVGFVNSLQLSANDLVRNGDWITVSKYDADGTVEEINLISVKVRNFDGTISTVPVRQLVTDTFQNWRGMEEQGVRRIKRSFFIDSKSIKKATTEMLKKIDSQQETNLGCLREYILNYLKHRNDININKICMVRILPINEFGIPIELYCFAKTIKWIEYEKIQSEIMEHILIALSQFDLVHYQRK
ncbi:MAG: mechanosensitive ion channel family protein [Bacteroidales bacterium]|jgi:miniconductance mechanosensitive channel|nr:mechanosensitive ion channel family protein [Bacteroidales bacterium]